MVSNLVIVQLVMYHFNQPKVCAGKYWALQTRSVPLILAAPPSSGGSRDQFKNNLLRHSSLSSPLWFSSKQASGEAPSPATASIWSYRLGCSAVNSDE